MENINFVLKFFETLHTELIMISKICVVGVVFVETNTHNTIALEYKNNVNETDR